MIRRSLQTFSGPETTHPDSRGLIHKAHQMVFSFNAYRKGSPFHSKENDARLIMPQSCFPETKLNLSYFLITREIIQCLSKMLMVVLVPLARFFFIKTTTYLALRDLLFLSNDGGKELQVTLEGCTIKPVSKFGNVDICPSDYGTVTTTLSV